MRGNTFVMLIIAVVFGAVAVFFANIWLNNQTARPTAVTVAPAQVETSTIVVASRNISFGEAIIPEALLEIPWPTNSSPRPPCRWCHYPPRPQNLKADQLTPSTVSQWPLPQ